MPYRDHHELFTRRINQSQDRSSMPKNKKRRSCVNKNDVAISKLAKIIKNDPKRLQEFLTKLEMKLR